MAAVSSEEPAMAATSSEEPAMAATSSEEPAMVTATAPKLPASGLSQDTMSAAGGRAGDGFGYVGVWAVDPATCATIDQPGSTGAFAVVTANSFRNGPNAGFGNFGPLMDGKLTATVVGGSTASITLEQDLADTLKVNGTAMVRCVP